MRASAFPQCRAADTAALSRWRVRWWIAKFQRLVFSSLGQKWKFIRWSSMIWLIWNSKAQKRLINSGTRLINFPKKSNCRVSGATRQRGQFSSCHRTGKRSQSFERVQSKVTEPVFWCDVRLQQQRAHEFMVGNSLPGKDRKFSGLSFVARGGVRTSALKSPSSPKPLSPIKRLVQSCLFLAGLCLKKPRAQELTIFPPFFR